MSFSDINHWDFCDELVDGMCTDQSMEHAAATSSFIFVPVTDEMGAASCPIREVEMGRVRLSFLKGSKDEQVVNFTHTQKKKDISQRKKKDFQRKVSLHNKYQLQPKQETLAPPKGKVVVPELCPLVPTTTTTATRSFLDVLQKRNSATGESNAAISSLQKREAADRALLLQRFAKECAVMIAEMEPFS